MKKILVISANPKQTSLTLELSRTYIKAINDLTDIRFFNLADMVFDPNLETGYDRHQPLEESIEQFQSALKWCDHLVIITPIWWGSLPAKFKGLIDRSLLPGFAFQYEKGMVLPVKLLKGKTARIIMLMDTPPWYYRLVQGSPAVKELTKPILKFVGFTPVKHHMFGPVIHSTDAIRENWAADIIKFAKSDL